jgi:hypothetical protein
MKTYLPLILLVSVVSLNAMEPKPGDNKETLEQKVQEAAEKMAHEQKTKEQQKIEKTMLMVLLESIQDHANAVKQQAAKAYEYGKEAAGELLEGETPYCKPEDLKAAAKEQVDKFSTWLGEPQEEKKEEAISLEGLNDTQKDLVKRLVEQIKNQPIVSQKNDEGSH